MSHTTTLHTLIQAPDLLVMPGVFDGFSARLVEQTGFAAGFITGAGLSETLLGYSDVGLMGFELNLAVVTRLAFPPHTHYGRSKTACTVTMRPSSRLRSPAWVMAAIASPMTR